jgi:hypothetical protein
MLYLHLITEFGLEFNADADIRTLASLLVATDIDKIPPEELGYIHKIVNIYTQTIPKHTLLSVRWWKELVDAIDKKRYDLFQRYLKMTYFRNKPEAEQKHEIDRYIYNDVIHMISQNGLLSETESSYDGYEYLPAYAVERPEVSKEHLRKVMAIFGGTKGAPYPLPLSGLSI